MKLPRPYDDELFGSIIARAAIHNGLAPKRLILRLTNKSKKDLHPFLPADLAAFSASTPMRLADLLTRHTQFGYVAAFASEQAAALLTERILSGRSVAGSSLGSLLRSFGVRRHIWRFCPQCTEADLRTLGESYWRRSHCLPACHWCRVHRCRLLIADKVPTTLCEYVTLPLPHRQLDKQEGPSAPAWAIETLATVSSATLTTPWQRRSDWPAVHRTAALTRGYELNAGNVAGLRLAAALRQAYGAAYLSHLRYDYDELDHAWPALIVRPGVRAPFSTTQHILLLTFLSREVRSEAVSFEYAPPGPRRRNYDDIDVRLAEAVASRHDALLRSGAHTTVRQLLQELGAWSIFRHQSSLFPMTARSLEVFKRSDASARKTGGREAHRKRLLAIREGRQKPLKPWASRTKTRR